MRRPLPSTVKLALAAVLAILSSAPQPGLAQFGAATKGRQATDQDVKVKSPASWQVYQRDANDKATIPIALDDSAKDVTIVEASASVEAGAMFGGVGMPRFDGIKYVDGKLAGVPPGGPYTVLLTLKRGESQFVHRISSVFVGDLWVLAGQSNMEGVGDLIDVTPPQAQVMLLGSDGRWGKAEEPLHWLVDSPDPVHSGDSATRAERSARQHKERRKGAGLGLPFAAAMVEATRVPVGLIACAHGGTSMAEWDPAKKGDGGKSLYGSMLRQVELAGGKVKGVLWYQGESDATPEASKNYHRTFADFIASVRADFKQPDLPFYYVQIGRFVRDSDPKSWNIVQEAQRRLPERVPGAAVVSVIDLELDDAIHVGTQGLKRAGHRLAKIAQRELFGQIGATTPSLDRVSRGPGNALLVKFKGVNMQHPAGTVGRMMGMASRGGMATTGAGMTSSASTMRGMMGASASGLGTGDSTGLGLQPERHIAGFSIRKEDGTTLPLIFEAAVGTARDTVVLKLTGPVPPKAFLWYGYGYDPVCNLTDGADMAVPVFGPVALDELPEAGTPVAAAASSSVSSSASAPGASASASSGAIKALIITGDNVQAHDWPGTTVALKETLSDGGKIKIDITSAPSKDLTAANLAGYDVLILNYRDTPAGSPESHWSDANKEAFLKAVRDGKGLVVSHYASAAFTKPNWDEFEKAVAGGWRSQGFHGPRHVFSVRKTPADHPASAGAPAQFEHKIDELYQNSMLVPGSTVLATAYSDPGKPRGTGKDEPVIWAASYGKGRVYNNALGHDVEAMSDPNYRAWLRKGVIWAATGKSE